MTFGQVGALNGRDHDNRSRVTRKRWRLGNGDLVLYRGTPPGRDSRVMGAITPIQFQVRFHGRGGQGVVTAAELLSVAAFFEGRHSQAFPTFGSERAGAPVAAFCRIADRAIRTRSPVV